MEHEPSYTAFAGHRRVASGDLRTTLAGVKAYLDHGGQDTLLIFEDGTGGQVDFDFRGTLEEVLERALPAPPHRGPGRPKMGVVSGEVSLLPRHWEWLAAQPQKASGTLRRLVEAAMRGERGGNAARLALEAADRFMSALAGDLPGYEEASRALYAKNWDRLEGQIRGWPEDVRACVLRLAQPAREAGPRPRGAEPA